MHSCPQNTDPPLCLSDWGWVGVRSISRAGRFCSPWLPRHFSVFSRSPCCPCPATKFSCCLLDQSAYSVWLCSPCRLFGTPHSICPLYKLLMFPVRADPNMLHWSSSTIKLIASPSRLTKTPPSAPAIIPKSQILNWFCTLAYTQGDVQDLQNEHCAHQVCLLRWSRPDRRKFIQRKF